MEILNVMALNKIFPAGLEKLVVLKDLELKVERGQTISITGESGSGKTTFLNLVSGLDSPTSGQVLINGIDISKLNEDLLAVFRRHTIGFIFQFHFLLKDFTALENILMPAYIAGTKQALAEEKAKNLLQDINLEYRQHAYPSELSGGERQRIAVARALMNDPAIIMADEPTGNLDERNSRIVQEMLFDLVSKYQKTMLLVTHDRRLARMADSNYELIGGALVPV